MVWDVIGIGEVRRREKYVTTLQSSHSKANNGQAGVGILFKKKRKDHIMRVNSFIPGVAELALCIATRYKLKIVQVYATTTSYSQEGINSVYDDVDETL